MLMLQPSDLVGGMAGIALQILVCGGYGYLLLAPLLARGHAWGLEQAGLSILLGFVALSWIGSLLAAASLFRWWLLLVAAAAVAVMTRRYVFGSPVLMLAPQPKWFQIAAIAVLALAAWLFARPAETFLLFEDSAVYTLAGINLAETGTLIPSSEPLVPKLYQITRYSGPFQWWNARATTEALSVGFLPTPKVWAALSAWLFGSGGAVWSAPLSGLIGLLALLLFVQRGLGRLEALVATALVAISFPQVWHSRVLMSETFAQVALFAGLYLMQVEREISSSARPRMLGAAAALSVALLALIRFEAALIVGVLLGAWLVAGEAEGPRAPLDKPVAWRRTWLVMLACFFAIGWVISFSVAPHYFLNQFILVLTRDLYRVLAIVAISVFALAILLRHHLGWRLRRLLGEGQLAHLLLSALALAWVAMMCLDLARNGLEGGRVTLWLPLYLGWAGFTLGACGILWLVLARPKAEVYALLVLALVFTIGYTLRPLVLPLHPWAIRRWVPYTVPVVAMGVGVLCGHVQRWVQSWGARRAAYWHWPGHAIWLACLGAALFFAWRATAPLALYREATGTWKQLEALSGLYPEDAVVFFDDGHIGQRLPQVMDLAFGYGVIAHLKPPGPTEFNMLDQAISQIHAQGREVYLQVIDGGIEWASSQYGLQSYASYLFEAPRLAYQNTPPPRAASIGALRFFVDIYRVVPREQLAPPKEATIRVPLAQGSYPYLAKEVYGPDTDDRGRPYRWLGEHAAIVVPVPALSEPPTEIRILLELASWRPEGASDTIVSVETEGRQLLEVRVAEGSGPQTVEIVTPIAPAPGQQTVAIELVNSTWRPSQYGISDQRTLGVMLYGATVTFVSDGSAH